MNRGPIVLFLVLVKTIEEAEYILDQFPPPSSDKDEITTKLRKRFQDLLKSLRINAEGISPPGA